MHLTISSLVAGCSICQHIKDSTQHTPVLHQPLPTPSCHFESWPLDLITHLPLSHGCNAVLTCVNHPTKLCRLTPCLMGGL